MFLYRRRYDGFRFEHRFQSTARRRSAGFWNGLWTTERPRKRKTDPPFRLCFRGMQGGEGPLPKGSVGGSQRTLEPCRGKRRKASPQKGPADSREHASCAAQKVIGTQAGLPARPFISLCGLGKSWGKFRENEILAGLLQWCEARGHYLAASGAEKRRRLSA